MTADQRRDELLGWISATRRTQRRLMFVIGAMILVSSGLIAWRLGIGMLALLITAIVGVTGFWITSSHIVDWNERLSELTRPRGVSGGGRRF